MNRHVEALAEEFLGRGHHVRVLAPFDPPDRLSRVLHRAPAEAREMPDYLVPMGRTAGFSAPTAPSPTSLPSRPAVSSPRAASCARAATTWSTSTSRWCRWSAGTRRLARRAPAVGTFHAYSTKALPNHIASALGAQADAQPALGADRRLRGGRLDRAPLVRRALRDRPERRRRRRRAAAARSRRATSCACSSSVAPRSARACRSCSPPSKRWSSTCPAASP